MPHGGVSSVHIVVVNIRALAQVVVKHTDDVRRDSLYSSNAFPPIAANYSPQGLSICNASFTARLVSREIPYIESVLVSEIFLPPLNAPQVPRTV